MPLRPSRKSLRRESEAKKVGPLKPVHPSETQEAGPLVKQHQSVIVDGDGAATAANLNVSTADGSCHGGMAQPRGPEPVLVAGNLADGKRRPVSASVIRRKMAVTNKNRPKSGNKMKRAQWTWA
jgi:hypothetical protein